ncbi:MAG TPA: hypothetical protein V6D05_04890, partial [Stenomitos sp.]
MADRTQQPESPRPRRWKGLNLKAQLLLAFCALAVLPTLIATVLLIQVGENSMRELSGGLTKLGQSSIVRTGNQISDSSVQSVSQSSDRLIKLSEDAINRTSDTLVGISETQLQGASREIIGLSQKTNDQVSEGMVRLSREAAERLSGELIGLSTSANQNLAKSTTRIAGQAVEDNTKRLIAINERLADELSDYLTKTNQLAAKEVSSNLMKDLERDPLVNFRVLARVIAQTFAGSRISEQRDAHITVVNEHGVVVASTRYKVGSDLKGLAFVSRALTDPAQVAAGYPLITYQDGTDSFLGVYARKADGGAVIVSYRLGKAQADMDALGATVDGAFDHLVKTTTSGTRLAISGSVPRIREEASGITASTVTRIREESDRLSALSAEQMTGRSKEISRTYAEGMTHQAKGLADQASEAMTENSQRIIEKAVAKMAPIGHQSARRAVEVTTRQAEQTVSEMKGQLPPRIRKASQEAADQMLPEAQAALAKSRLWTLTIGFGTLILAALFGILVSFGLSRRIADPIEVEKKLQQAELDRMGKEMEIATRIQTALVPTDVAVENYDLAVDLLTATEV